MGNGRRYIFNPLTLSYEIKRETGWSGVLKVFAFLGLTMMIAVIVFAIYTSLGFHAPKTAYLRKKNAELTSRIEVLSRQLEQHSDDLYALQVRDDGIYRSIFGMNPVPSTVRDVGLKGTNRYAEYDGRLKEVVRTVDVLMKKTYVQSKSFDEVALLSKRAGEMSTCIPAIPPMVPDRDVYHFSSPFGPRYHPIYGGTRMHTGVDLSMDRGTPIYATGDGVIHSVRFEPTGYGNQVVIDHGFGYKSRYAHMQTVGVVEGMKVKRGECIGLSGNSGSSTGPHLHYEVLYKDAHVNPSHYFDLTITPEEYATMVQLVADSSDKVTMHRSVN